MGLGPLLVASADAVPAIPVYIISPMVGGATAAGLFRLTNPEEFHNDAAADKDDVEGRARAESDQ